MLPQIARGSRPCSAHSGKDGLAAALKSLTSPTDPFSFGDLLDELVNQGEAGSMAKSLATNNKGDEVVTQFMGSVGDDEFFKKLGSVIDPARTKKLLWRDDCSFSNCGQLRRVCQDPVRSLDNQAGRGGQGMASDLSQTPNVDNTSGKILRVFLEFIRDDDPPQPPQPPQPPPGKHYYPLKEALKELVPHIDDQGF